MDEQQKTIVLEYDGCGRTTNYPITQVFWDEGNGKSCEMLLPFTMENVDMTTNAIIGWKFVESRAGKNSRGDFAPEHVFEPCRLLVENRWGPFTVRYKK